MRRGRGQGAGGRQVRRLRVLLENAGRLYLGPPHVPALSCVALSSRADWPGSETVKRSSLTDEVSSCEQKGLERGRG